jgi:hypothetical protein
LQVQQTVSAERGDIITMLAFICANGSSIPPTFIFPRKKMKPEFYDNGCLGFSRRETGKTLYFVNPLYTYYSFYIGWMIGENNVKSLVLTVLP